MQLLLSTCPFDAGRLARILPVVRESGFDTLELKDEDVYATEPAVLDEIAHAASDCGFAIPNWHLLMDSPFKPTADERRATIDKMKESMDRGNRVGAANHVLHWYHRFLDPSCDALWRSTLDEWVDHAARRGVRLLMETVPDKPSNERYVPSHEIADCVSHYPAKHLSFCLDVNHSNLQENLPDVVHVLKDRLVSLHISDNDGKGEKHWLPGQGVIDFPTLFGALAEISFDGMMVLEVHPWCEQVESPAQLRKLHDFGQTLLTTGIPHPDSPARAQNA